MDAIARLTVRRTRVHRRSPHGISVTWRNRCIAANGELVPITGRRSP